MKRLLIIVIIFLAVGCSNEKINTIIEEENNIFISINYPTTNIKKLDKLLKEDIDTIYSDFKKDSIKDAELNIDYTYYKSNNYIMITISIYIYNNSVTNNIKTYLFDIKNNKFLNINDVLNNEDISNIKNDISNNIDNFSFDNNYLYIYVNSNNNYQKFKYDINKINILIPIDSPNTKQTYKSFDTKTRVLNPNDKFIALTFDDGPSIYTSAIIQILKENDVNATFFILGNKVEIYSDVLNKSLSYGNELGNHSYNHKWLTKLNEENIKEQIYQTQDIIKKYTGYTPTVFRPTYGSINNLIRNCSDLNIVLWTIDTLDWKYKSVKKIVNRATRKVKDGDIILMHETYKRTVNAIKQIIPILKKKGFTFVTVSELEEINKIRANEN